MSAASHFVIKNSLSDRVFETAPMTSLRMTRRIFMATVAQCRVGSVSRSVRSHRSSITAAIRN
eukprot:5184926-Karenia_brevis.AAC.1